MKCSEVSTCLHDLTKCAPAAHAQFLLYTSGIAVKHGTPLQCSLCMRPDDHREGKPMPFAGACKSRNCGPGHSHHPGRFLALPVLRAMHARAFDQLPGRSRGDHSILHVEPDFAGASSIAYAGMPPELG